MARSEALKRAQARYQAKRQKAGEVPQKTFVLKCHVENDADVIAVLNEQENKSGYIKELIRMDTEKRG